MMSETLLGVPLVIWSAISLAIGSAYYFVWPKPEPRRVSQRTVREHVVLRYFHSLVWVLIAIGCFLAAAGIGEIGRWIALLGIPVYIIFIVYIVRDRRKEDAARAAQRAGAHARDAGTPQ
jgi:hypothetical protein